MQPQLFLLGLDDGSSRVHVNKYEALTSINYTTIQSTQKNIQRLVCKHQNQKRNVGFKTSFSIGIQPLSAKNAPRGYVP